MTSYGSLETRGRIGDIGRRGSFASLYVRPEIERFAPGQEEKLAQFLETVAAATTTARIEGPGDLQLGENGQTLHGGYRYTKSGFFQAARKMAPGLGLLVPSLAGASVRGNDSTEMMIDGYEARRIWNRIAELRIAVFRHCVLLRNDTLRQIEGVCGANYRVLSNTRFHQAARELAAGEPVVEFVGAALLGRQLMLWYRRRQPLFSVEHPGGWWPVHGGYYFMNSESLNASVRGTVAVYTPAGPCLGPYEQLGAKVAHLGKNFDRHLRGMLDRVRDAQLPVEALRQGAAALFIESLGLAPGADDRRGAGDGARNRAGKARESALINALGQLGVPLRLAREVVDLAIRVGRQTTVGPAPPIQLRSEERRRYMVDLLVPLLRTARKLDGARRERLERAAYDILVGGFPALRAP